MTPSSGGEAIVSGLVAHGVDTVFGLPGAQIYGLFDAFQQAQLKVIGARHEQACGYMAYGYARSTGRPGVFSVVPGPGVLNAGAALLTAFGANEPVLCLTGQVPTQFLGKGRGHLHEMPDQLATLRSFVKWADRIEYPDAAPALVSRAFQEMMSGRRGPVALEMPWDVFTQRAETGAAKPFDPFPAPQPDSERTKAAAALIAGSKTPMIFVGSGAIHARDEILELAELIDAPVVAFRSGRGIVTNELSQVGFTSWYGFPVYEPRTFITSGYQGTLGSGFPTALGAKVAHPDRTVVAITGDGGFMFGVQELATAVQFNIGVVVLVFNNNAYGNVRRDQRERFEGRVVASDLVNPDFVKLAESFGVAAARVTSPQTFRPALEKALAHGGPYLIDVEVPKDSETSPWTFIHPAKP